jgi:hypothetical protein
VVTVVTISFEIRELMRQRHKLRKKSEEGQDHVKPALVMFYE